MYDTTIGTSVFVLLLMLCLFSMMIQLTENYFGVVDNINGIPTDTLRESVFQANVSAR